MKKSPDAPKRGKTAYILFTQATRPAIKERMGGASSKVTEVMQAVAEEWRKLTAEEKQYWEMKAVEDKARYQAELADFTGPLKVPARRKGAKDLFFKATKPAVS